MSECRQLRRYLTSKLYPNLKNIHNLNKLCATASSAQNDSQTVFERDHELPKLYLSHKLPKSISKLNFRLASDKCFYNINNPVTTNSTPVRSLTSEPLFYRNYSSFLMGLISTKCNHHPMCGCCSENLSSCRCNCEKSTRCFCAGPTHFHRIGLTHHNRWFSSNNHKMSNKELVGMDLLREPNVNKVSLIIIISIMSIFY